ncbi:MAG: hypothetical protein K2L06_05560 [Alistipes sp.]|nr:hypothetical protein [Alistipes sp.]
MAAPKILPLGKIQVNLLLRSAYSTLAAPKILPLGKIQVNLLLRSLIRIFASQAKRLLWQTFPS